MAAIGYRGKQIKIDYNLANRFEASRDVPDQVNLDTFRVREGDISSSVGQCE